MTGTGATRTRTRLQFPTREPAKGPNHPKPCSFSEGNSGSLEQGLGSLWPKSLTIDDSQWQHASHYRTPNDQYLDISSLPIDPLLPRPSNGRPNDKSSICDYPTTIPTSTIFFNSNTKSQTPPLGNLTKEINWALEILKGKTTKEVE